MKCILEAKDENDQATNNENLGTTSIENMLLGIVRYVRHLDMTVHAIHIKTKLCQLVEVMMNRRDDLAFRQEMKFRNKLVEYLTDWVMGTSHQIQQANVNDAAAINRYNQIESVDFLRIFATKSAFFLIFHKMNRCLTAHRLSFATWTRRVWKPLRRY